MGTVLRGVRGWGGYSVERSVGGGVCTVFERS